MRLGSRLRRRRKQVTISVYSKSVSSGQLAESAVSGLVNIKATKEPAGQDPEIVTEAGVIVIATDNFYFDQISGSLPAITENHLLIDSDSARYEVVTRPFALAGEDNRLKVITRKVNN